jgi:hypothetical protein
MKLLIRGTNDIKMYDIKMLQLRDYSSDFTSNVRFIHKLVNDG